MTTIHQPVHEPVEHVRPGGDPRVIFLCDHARNTVPAALGGCLGLPPEDMARHIAHDIGARGVTLALAETFGAPALLTCQSRLVIDPNRGADDPTLVMQLYDGSIIPGNRAIGADQIAARRVAYYDPYHAAITGALDRAMAAGVRPAIVAIHSFTPQLRGRPPRPWQVGILYAADDRLARPLMAALRADGFCVGDNEPYHGALDGDTLDQHGIRRGLPHVLIEIRNDLIGDAAGEAAWAARLTGPLRRALATLPEE